MDNVVLIACIPIALVVVFLAFGLVFSNRYRKVGPNEVLVISGGRKKKDGQAFRIVRGGGTFVWPAIERIDTRLRGRFGMTTAQTAVGALDLRHLRLA